MVRREPSRLARILQLFAVFGLFLLFASSSGEVSASCGDYLAGNHTSHGGDSMASEKPISTPRSSKCSCESGQCEASLPLSQQNPSPSVKFRDSSGLESATDEGRSRATNQWRRPSNTSTPLSPFYAVLSPPPERVFA